MTAIHAARVAARLRRDLGIEVGKVSGRYGEFKVEVDGKVVVEGGALGALGVLPPVAGIVERVRNALAM